MNIVGGHFKKCMIVSKGLFNLRYELLKLEGFNQTKIMDLNEDTVYMCRLYDSEHRRSTGSTIGRAAVGGVLFGPAGAIVGGMCGKKKSKYYIEIVLHDERCIIVECDKTEKQLLLSTLS